LPNALRIELAEGTVRLDPRSFRTIAIGQELGSGRCGFGEPRVEVKLDADPHKEIDDLVPRA
jgi:hypothetical protein